MKQCFTREEKRNRNCQSQEGYEGLPEGTAHTKLTREGTGVAHRRCCKKSKRQGESNLSWALSPTVWIHLKVEGSNNTQYGQGHEKTQTFFIEDIHSVC